MVKDIFAGLTKQANNLPANKTTQCQPIENAPNTSNEEINKPSTSGVVPVQKKDVEFSKFSRGKISKQGSNCYRIE